MAVERAWATVPVQVAPVIIPTEEHAEVQIISMISMLGAGKHTSAGIMAAVDTPVVMVVGAAEEKAEREETRVLIMGQAVVEGATAVAVLVSRGVAVVVVAVLSFPQ